MVNLLRKQTYKTKWLWKCIPCHILENIHSYCSHLYKISLRVIHFYVTIFLFLLCCFLFFKTTYTLLKVESLDYFGICLEVTPLLWLTVCVGLSPYPTSIFFLIHPSLFSKDWLIFIFLCLHCFFLFFFCVHISHNHCFDFWHLEHCSFIFWLCLYFL